MKEMKEMKEICPICATSIHPWQSVYMGYHVMCAAKARINSKKEKNIEIGTIIFDDGIYQIVGIERRFLDSNQKSIRITAKKLIEE